MADEPIERIYIIPLRKVYDRPRSKRAKLAITLIRKFISQHMKSDLDMVWLDRSVNEKVWERGIQKPPRKIQVRAVKFPEDGLVEVSIPEE